MSVRFLQIIGFVLLAFSTNGVWAWEATYPSGPVRTDASKASLAVRISGPIGSYRPSFAAVSDLPAAGAFDTRVVPYPSTQGVELGSGWDFIANVARQSRCVEFTPVDDSKYQNGELKLDEITDEDILNITLNTEFKGEVGGSIEGITAKADATTTINATHHIASKDITFVAHASVTSGINFTGVSVNDNSKDTPRIPLSTRLTKEMVQLATAHPDDFRARCGDGFVGSIGNGADLYIMLHFHDLNAHDRLELSFDSKASAGAGDIFEAKGSSKLSGTIDRLSTEQKLDISFVQKGGMVSLPTSLEGARTAVTGLAVGEEKSPRKTFVSVIPYSRLANWPPVYIIETSDIRQRTRRFIERLDSLLYEAYNIRENLYRDRGFDSVTGGSDQYYYYYRHGLRPERPLDVANKAGQLRTIAIKYLRKLGEEPCSTKAVRGSGPPESLTRTEKRVYVANRAEEVRKLVQKLDDCTEIVEDLLAKTANLDDLVLWAGLPVPLNTVPESTALFLEKTSNPINDRKKVYAQLIFRHWVERINQSRCRTLRECLSTVEMSNQYKQIQDSFLGVTMSGRVNVNYPFCIGQTNGICAGQVPDISGVSTTGETVTQRRSFAGDIKNSMIAGRELQRPAVLDHAVERTQ